VFDVGAGDQSGELVVPVNAPVRQFTLKRANDTGYGTLPFDVIDGCGLWKSLAGGDPNAWPGGPASASAPAVAEPSPSPATPPAALATCSPERPKVGVTTVRNGAGQLQSTLSAQTLLTVPTNSLRSVRIGAVNNAVVTLNGSPVAAGQTVTLAAGAQQATLTVSRNGPDASAQRAFGAGFTVTDACGEWQSFVGIGSGV
jgi:hypothetical protein